MMRFKKLSLCVLSGLGTATIASSQILPPPPERPQYDANGVDMQTQLMQYSHTDLSIGPADHHGLAYTLYYSGQIWRNTFSNSLEFNSETDTQIAAMGNRSESFDGGVPTNGNGSSAGLGAYTFGEGAYTLKDGTFVSFGHLVAPVPSIPSPTLIYFADYMEYPDGVRLTFHYRGDTWAGQGITRLRSVTTNTGFQMKFYYEVDTLVPSDVTTRGKWTTITKVVASNDALEYCNPDADSCSYSNSWPQATYAWSSSGGTATVEQTDATGGQTTISYSPTQVLVKTPDSSSNNRTYSLAFTAGPSGSTYRVNNAIMDGKVTTYSFNHTTTVSSFGPLADNRTYVSAINEPGIIQFTDALSRPFLFAHDQYGRTRTITSPEGNWTEYQYDDNSSGIGPSNSRGNITLAKAYPKPGSGLAVLSESRTYPICASSLDKVCNQPSSYADPRGAITNYDYDPNSGGKLIEKRPPDVNGIRPVLRYAYRPRYAWVKNSAGTAYVAAPTRVYLLTEERTCRTSTTNISSVTTVDGVTTVGAACSAGSSDELVTSYDYGPKYEDLPTKGPNNLLLRGKVVTYAGVSRTTCYGYDKYGNKISETLPRAGLSSCP